MMGKIDGLEWMFRLSVLAFALGSIGVVAVDPIKVSPTVWLIIGLSAMFGLTGMLGAIAAKLLGYMIKIAKEEDNKEKGEAGIIVPLRSRLPWELGVAFLILVLMLAIPILSSGSGC